MFTEVTDVVVPLNRQFSADPGLHPTDQKTLAVKFESRVFGRDCPDRKEELPAPESGDAGSNRGADQPTRE